MHKEDCFHLGIKALITNHENKILLFKVNTSTFKNYNGDAYWDIPGGRIQKGDTVESTLKREVAEETGITEINGYEHLSTVISNIRIPTTEDNDVGLILSVFKCAVKCDKPMKISEEHTEAQWFTPAQASELLAVKYPSEFTETIKNL